MKMEDNKAMTKIDKILLNHKARDDSLSKINETLFDELRPFFRAAMSSDLEFCVKTLKFTEKWYHIVRTLVDFTYRYVNLNDSDWYDFVDGILERK